jgi:hypothetical protein
MLILSVKRHVPKDSKRLPDRILVWRLELELARVADIIGIES